MANEPTTASTTAPTKGFNFMDCAFPLMPRRLRPDNNHRCYCDMNGIGSGRAQTRGALSRHSEDRGRWPLYFWQADSTAADFMHAE